MEKDTRKTAMILKYAKRRYDGGPEIDLIRAIERKQASNRQTRLVEVEVPVPTSDEKAVAAEKPLSIESLRKKQIVEAFIMGPLELCVGVVGMLTALMAIVTFRRLDNTQLAAQSQEVFCDCLKTFRKGMWDTLTTPVRVAKVASAKS